MIVKVTPTHIKKGLRGNFCYCPIALAVKDACKTNEFDVRVTHNQMSILNPITKKYDKIDLHKDAITFIKRFDKGERVDPFQFVFPILVNQTNKGDSHVKKNHRS